MNHRANLLIALIALFFLPTSLHAQFTYVDVTLGNSFMNVYKSGSKKSKYDQTNLQINGLWRFRRNFGVGITASVPIREGGRYYLLTNQSSGLTKHSYDLKGLDLKYYFSESMKIAFNGRIYFGVKNNYYVDGRISMFSTTENLSFIMGGKTYTENNKFNQLAPGFSVGLNPHIGENMYFNLNLAWDFYKYKNHGFKNGNSGIPEAYILPNGSFSELMAFKSPVSDKALSFSFNIGLGYRF
ncbi:MAG: hypothetical protein PHQ74_01990 [Crocinitomicaceae bacterium]|nr:hypothetical protein [Crocinitomicaceae bacterium]